MPASNKISVKSMEYDTKSYTYDTTYDTKTINRNDNLCYSFYILPKKQRHICANIQLSLYRDIFYKTP